MTKLTNDTVLRLADEAGSQILKEPNWMRSAICFNEVAVHRFAALIQAELEKAEQTEPVLVTSGCLHPTIHAGSNQAWCETCGVITWASDGLSVGVPGDDAKAHAEWCGKNITAWGCSYESPSDQRIEAKRCDHWCGNRLCPTTLNGSAK